MQIFLAALLGGLIQSAGTIVGKVLISLGIGYATFTGVDTSITWARDFAVTKITALPPLAVSVASTMQIGTCISILSSALAARLVLQGLTGGTLRRFVNKG